MWDTGNGDLGNQGIHQMDIARRFTGEMTLSPRVFSVGGRLGYVDDGETPNSLFVVHEYEKAPLIFEVRGLPEKTDAKEMDKYRGASVGVVVQYENGHILCPDYNDAIAYDKDGDGDSEIRRAGRRRRRRGRPAPPRSDLRENHFEQLPRRPCAAGSPRRSMARFSTATSPAPSATPAISRTASGRRSRPASCAKQSRGTPRRWTPWSASSPICTANGVDPNVDKLALGAFLKMDPQTERFIGNPEADKMLTREYRAPFVVPEQV